MAKVLGRATVKVDGDVLLIDNGAKFNLGGVTRKIVKGTEVHGFAEESVEPSIEVVATVNGKTSLARWGKIENATVTFEADTGQIWSLANAWLEAPPEVTAGEGGKVTLKFVAAKAEEQTGAA